MPNRVTKGQGLIAKGVFGSALIGAGGTEIKKVKKGTFALDPASITANTKAGTAVTITGVAAGDVVAVVPPSDLEDDLIPAGAVVTGADELTVYLYNASAGAVDGASKTWTYLWFDLT